MTTKSYVLRTKRVPLDAEIARLETFVSRMERRYECTTARMQEDIRLGQARETAEVGRWLANYQALGQLKDCQAIGPAIGSGTTTTG